MPSHDADRALERWLAGALGDGTLVDVGGVLVDTVALGRRRHACRPALCTPGRRARGVLSCCADIEVTLTAGERRAVDARLPLVAATMRARDRRWADGAPAVYADAAARQPSLARPGRRCVFAFPSADGLRCGLHATAEQHGLPLARLKPSPCRLFPLVLLRRGGRTLLTAQGEASEALGGPPESRLACVAGRGDGKVLKAPPLHEACRGTIVELFGEEFYAELARALAQGRRLLSTSRASTVRW